jgi:hypothetical protein
MVDDETLMAYADGELEPAARLAVEEAAARDPVVADRLKAHAALREKMAEAFADVLHDPVPASLRALASGEAPSGAVIDFAAARTRLNPEVRRKIALPTMSGAMAACLAAGLLLGAGLGALRPAALITGRAGSLLAQGPLVAALDTQLSARPPANQSIRIGISFRNTKNEYCRTFRIDGDGALAGIACRTPAAWSVNMAAATAARVTSVSPAYRTASSVFPPLVMQTVQDMSVGAPLDADAEGRAKAAGWR